MLPRWTTARSLLTMQHNRTSHGHDGVHWPLSLTLGRTSTRLQPDDRSSELGLFRPVAVLRYENHLNSDHANWWAKFCHKASLQRHVLTISLITVWPLNGSSLIATPKGTCTSLRRTRHSDVLIVRMVHRVEGWARFQEKGENRRRNQNM